MLLPEVLPSIDAGNRRGYVHLLHDNLFVCQHHPDAVHARVNLALHGLVEAGLLGANLVRRVLVKDVSAMAGIVGPQPDGGESRLKNRNLSAGNRQAILVHGRQDNRRADGWRLRPCKDCAEEKKQAGEEPLRMV